MPFKRSVASGKGRDTDRQGEERGLILQASKRRAAGSPLVRDLGTEVHILL